MSYLRKFIFTERESKMLTKEASHLACTQNLNFFFFFFFFVFFLFLFFPSPSFCGSQAWG